MALQPILPVHTNNFSLAGCFGTWRSFLCLSITLTQRRLYAATFIANRGQLLVPFYANDRLFVKEKIFRVTGLELKKSVVRLAAASI